LQFVSKYYIIGFWIIGRGKKINITSKKYKKNKPLFQMGAGNNPFPSFEVVLL